MRSDCSNSVSIISNNIVRSASKALAFDEEGYIEFIVSKTNGSNNNSTSAAQIPEGAKGPYSAKGLFG